MRLCGTGVECPVARDECPGCHGWVSSGEGCVAGARSCGDCLDRSGSQEGGTGLSGSDGRWVMTDGAGREWREPGDVEAAWCSGSRERGWQ